MPGKLTIPNTFANASGQVPAIQLDQDYNAIRDYVNAREITFGTIGSRPGPSTSGRFYFATDTAQLFADTGTAWIPVGVSSGQGMWGLRRPVGQPNPATPLTQYDISADVVQLRNPTTGQVVTVMNPGTRTNNILAAGPAPNGRDQAAVFSPNTYIHLYHIHDGTSLATLSSLAGPTTGPTMPGGYTTYSYFNTLRLNASTQFMTTRTMGSWVYYVGLIPVLSGGASPTPAVVDVSFCVPPLAMAYYVADIGWAITSDGSGTVGGDLSIQIVPGTVYTYLARPFLTGLLAGSQVRSNVGPQLQIPNINQQFSYQWSSVVGTGPLAAIAVMAYQVPNGSE